MEAKQTVWDIRPDGQRIDAIELKSPAGVHITLINYGATIVSVKLPSKASPAPEEVTLCYDNFAELHSKSPYYGSTVGRVANRISRGVFSLDGTSYKLACNNGVNHLHGGVVGYDKVMWEYSIRVTGEAASVEFKYESHDGEEGYPGRALITATYSLSIHNELRMHFTGESEAKTIMNVCNHTYWNLSGNLSSKIADHEIRLSCPSYLPVDATQPVEGSPFDLTSPTLLGDRLRLVDGGGEPGFDHCFVRGSTPSADGSLLEIAALHHPSSGRKMVVFTTAPAVQLYTGNFLSKDSADAPHDQHRALCLETENFPDAINHPSFPSPIIGEGRKYEHVTVHHFSW